MFGQVLQLQHIFLIALFFFFWCAFCLLSLKPVLLCVKEATSDMCSRRLLQIGRLSDSQVGYDDMTEHPVQ